MTDAPTAPIRPKRSNRMPMLVFAFLALLLAGVWWHIRSQHQPSVALSGKVAYTVVMPEGRSDYDVFVYGLPALEGVLLEVDAMDSVGRAGVIGHSIKQKDEKTVQAHLKLRLNPGAKGLELRLTFSHEVAAVTPLVDRLLHLAPRREQIGQLTLTKIPVFNQTPPPWEFRPL